MVIGLLLELKPISFISYLNLPEHIEPGNLIVTAFQLVSTPIISSFIVAVYAVVETVVMFNSGVTSILIWFDDGLDKDILVPPVKY